MLRRIQLHRTKGWRLPEGTVVVSRPSRFGNPFKMHDLMASGVASSLEDARRIAIERYRDWVLCGEESEWWTPELARRHAAIWEHLSELRGKDLACWCPEGGPCHADVLMELANGECVSA